MATIAILIDFYEGHIFPTFRLARALRAGGHRVCYLGIADTAESVRTQGFEFIEIFSDTMPAGSARRLRALAGRDIGNYKLMQAAQESYFDSLVSGKLFEELIADLRPDVMLVLSFFTVEALVIQYRYGIPVVLLTPYLRQETRVEACRLVIERILDLKSGVAEMLESIEKSGVRLQSLADITGLILLIPELTIVAAEFELPDRPKDPNTHYIGAGVDLDRVEQPFEWDRVDTSRPIVYGSLGSQPDIYGEAGPVFFRLMIEAAALRPQWQFIIAIGRKLDLTQFKGAPDHIHFCHWAPQLTVLSRAIFMVTHGGMGTVKECILMGVPMLVLPVVSGSMQAGDRVAHHGLGLKVNTRDTSPAELATLMDQLATQDRFRHNVSDMREAFLRGENIPLAIRVIEQTATRKAQNDHRGAAALPTDDAVPQNN
jgi:zeaxanthin glucosyltransferase